MSLATSRVHYGWLASRCNGLRGCVRQRPHGLTQYMRNQTAPSITALGGETLAERAILSTDDAASGMGDSELSKAIVEAICHTAVPHVDKETALHLRTRGR